MARSQFPAHSPSGHLLDECWCQDVSTGGAHMTRHEIGGAVNAGDQTIEYNGIETAVRDIPSAFERAQFGYGHFPGHGRQVVDVPEMNWPHTPDTCPTDEVINRWLFAGTNEVLVCMGCGLDVT